MGRTHLARKQDDSNPVALKTVDTPGRDGVRRFSAGLEVLSDLKHPNLASILDVGVEGDRVYYSKQFGPRRSALESDRSVRRRSGWADEWSRPR